MRSEWRWWARDPGAQTTGDAVEGELQIFRGDSRWDDPIANLAPRATGNTPTTATATSRPRTPPTCPIEPVDGPTPPQRRHVRCVEAHAPAAAQGPARQEPDPQDRAALRGPHVLRARYVMPSPLSLSISPTGRVRSRHAADTAVCCGAVRCGAVQRGAPCADAGRSSPSPTPAPELGS